MAAFSKLIEPAQFGKKKSLKISCLKNPTVDTHLPSMMEQHLLGK